MDGAPPQVSHRIDEMPRRVNLDALVCGTGSLCRTSPADRPPHPGGHRPLLIAVAFHLGQFGFRVWEPKHHLRGTVDILHGKRIIIPRVGKYRRRTAGSSCAYRATGRTAAPAERAWRALQELSMWRGEHGLL